MHIVQVVPHYLPAVRFGGPQHVAHGLGKALAEAGHRVSVCTTNLQDERNDLNVPLDRPVERDGVSVYYSPTAISRFWGFSPGLRDRADQLISTADLVLVHAHYQYANWIGARLARRHRKPYAVFAHGSLREVAIRERGRFRKALYLAIVERANLRDATLLVFNADEERDGSRYADRGIVVANGLDPADYHPSPPKGLFRRRLNLPDDAVVLLYLGRIDVERKGLDLLLPAFARVAARNPRLHLVIAGPDERNGQRVIESLTARLGIRDRVLLPGLLTGQDKLAALVDADAFALTSRSEGLSISLLEALYIGIPVVVSDQVGMHRTVGKLNAGIVVPATVDDIADGLEVLIRPESLLAMRGRAIHWIETHHVWSVIADELLHALDDKLGEAGARGRKQSLTQG